MDRLEETRAGLVQYVETITEKSQGKNKYKCPLCRSGSGRHGTGAFTITEDGTRWKCFSCGEGGDLFDLIGQVEGLTEFTDQKRRAEEFLGIEDGAKSSTKWSQNLYKKQGAKAVQSNGKIVANAEKNTDRKQGYEEDHAEPAEDLTLYFKACQAQLSKTDYLERRGISQKTAERFGLGYDSQFAEGVRTPWQALIIPTGRGTFVARNTDPGAEDRYRAHGQRNLYYTVPLHQASKPVYVVEGELDALSIAEAGGEAVALQSTANWRKLVTAVKQKAPAQPMILALDNDGPGWKTTEELEKALRDSGTAYYTYNPYGEHKDANEALTANREAFEASLRRGEDVEALAKEAKLAKIRENSPATHLQEFINGIAESVNTPAITTGFRELDTVLDGGLYEGLYIVGAIPSLGKTTLVTQIADQVAMTGQDVLIFSLEMARAELMAKSISRHTLTETLATDKDMRKPKTTRGITNGSRYANYSQAERELIEKAISAYGEYAGNLFIVEGQGELGTDQIREEIQRHVEATGRAPVVIVDYVQILAPHDVRATDKQTTDHNARELKRISRDYKIPVIGISSFNRANYSQPVAMEAFKESGGLEYGSDVLIGLQLAGVGRKDFDVNEAKQSDPREIELVILKNRNGRTGDTVALQYYPLFNYFKEC